MPPRPEYCYPLLHVDHLDEGKSDASSQPPVGHDELLLDADSVHPPLVDQESEGKDTDEPEGDVIVNYRYTMNVYDNDGIYLSLR